MMRFDGLFQSKKNMILVGGVCFLLILTLSFVLFAPKGGRVETLPQEGVDLDFSREVDITGARAVYNRLGGLAFSSVARDLFTYSRLAYPEYSSGKQEYSQFIAEDTTEETNTSIVFYGSFFRTKSRVRIEITPRNYDRYSIAILDKSVNLSIDKNLASNSARNQFIGSLPIDGGSYTIDYTETGDQITITSFDATDEEIAGAVSKIAEKLGKNIQEGVDYSIFQPTSSGEGMSADDLPSL